MSKDAAFRFIPELLGDYAHVMELSRNPKLLYVEAAVKTLHMASDIFLAVEEHRNTKLKAKTKQALQENYKELERARTENYETEAVRKLDVLYETVKNKLREGQFRDSEVIGFIQYLHKDLKKVLEIFKTMQVDPDYPEKARIEEITRRTLRDYNKLITLFFEEDETNGQD